MATYQITHVRTAQPRGWQHEHITHVRTSVGLTLARAEVVEDILKNYAEYFTYALGTRADVYVRDCPSCGRGDYITTRPDWTTQNNLLSLPRF